MARLLLATCGKINANVNVNVKACQSPDLKPANVNVNVNVTVNVKACQSPASYQNEPITPLISRK